MGRVRNKYPRDFKLEAVRALRAGGRRFSTTGHLFERRYHAVLVDADAYLLELMRYIHLNSVRAHMVNAPGAYPWSSHHAYLNTRTEAWVTTDFALSLFHVDRRQATAAYDQFVHGQTGSGESPLNALNPNDLRILGSNKFAARVLGRHWQPRSNKTFEQLVDEACQQFDVKPEELASHSRHRHVTYVRAWIAHQALILRIASLAQTAHTFNRNESSLRESIKLHFSYP